MLVSLGYQHMHKKIYLNVQKKCAVFFLSEKEIKTQ